MSSRFVHSLKPKPHATSHSSRNELELSGASAFHSSGSTQRSVKSQAASTSPPSWSSTSLSTGTRITFHPQLHQSAPTALERQSSAALLPIYSQTDSQPRPHTLPIHESAKPQASLFGAEPTSTGGCRVLIPEQVNVRNEADLLDLGLLAAMWSSLEEQRDQAGAGVQGGAVTVAGCSGKCGDVGRELAGDCLELYDGESCLMEDLRRATGPSQTKEDSVELSASIATHIAAAWEAHNGHLARRGIDSHV
ncbi:hypothetical protein EHS25_000896 [Saitozyma podzolica]|uniref:Uncharacterized protein n=1 Tax=Saitozyma podzolica TaxID=1890683 RepID=A0A427YXK1_9TREE|nr:hypothetical protein EHS25_000896 [Saitozyma podzolica]